MASGIGATIRFVGLGIAVTGLGALFAGNTFHNLVAATAKLNILLAADGNMYGVVSHITSGGVFGFVASVPEGQRSLILSLCRSSSGEAFASILFAAESVAVIAYLLVFATIDSKDTLPQKSGAGAIGDTNCGPLTFGSRLIANRRASSCLTIVDSAIKRYFLLNLLFKNFT